MGVGVRLGNSYQNVILRSYEDKAIVLLNNDEKWLVGVTFDDDFLKVTMMIKTKLLFLLMKLELECILIDQHVVDRIILLLIVQSKCLSE